ncbi:MAG: Fic family protein [Planctomycetota bacterium]
MTTVKIPKTPPPVKDRLAILHDPNAISALAILVVKRTVTATPHGKYLHWDELLHRQPPEGLSHEMWWAAIRLVRAQTEKQLPLPDKQGGAFSYTSPDPVLELLQKIDRDASGNITLSEEATSPESRDRYIVSSLIEEAITSSQLEGAATTRRVAKDMLRSGRKPRTVGERMILNNYAALSHVRAVKDRDLSPELIFSLHRLLTNHTIDDPAEIGDFRKGQVYVFHETSDLVLHNPPPVEQLPGRMEEMCRFANGEIPNYYVHPVIRAIVLHFWLAYDHPFVDGNGRTARALFYWSMLHQGYWLCEYISLSDIVKKAPAKYARAFLHSETDENDVTYFILHQLKCIIQALDNLTSYLSRKAKQLRTARFLLRKSTDLVNHRQLALLSHALKKPGTDYTFESHRVSHNIVRQTARSDLLGLVDLGLLEKSRQGRKHVFRAVPNLAEELATLGS